MSSPTNDMFGVYSNADPTYENKINFKIRALICWQNYFWLTELETKHALRNVENTVIIP